MVAGGGNSSATQEPLEENNLLFYQWLTEIQVIENRPYEGKSLINAIVMRPGLRTKITPFA